MPRLILEATPRSLGALLALRRSLWQLAILGAASAIAVGALNDAPGVMPAWLLLAPASALLAHHRDALAALLRMALNHRRTTRRRRPARHRPGAVLRTRLPRPTLSAQQVR